MIKKIDQQLTYPLTLILSTAKRKTCESLAPLVGKSGDTFCRLLKEKTVTPDDLIKIAKNTLSGKSYYLILDDTLIAKTYAEWIEGACDNYDSANGKVVHSLCSVVAMLSDGKTAIPIDQELWLSREIMKNDHKTKVATAIDLIMRVRKKVKIKMIIADGLYATEEMMLALEQKSIYFEMRFHANRIVEYKGIKSAVRDLGDLKLKGRRAARTKRATWKKMNLYFTSVKRVTKTGRIIIVYQVSNFSVSAKKHVQIYGFRWNIEKFFRTSKQHLGLAHCQVRSKTAQENHIFNVFFAYALLQTETRKFTLKNPEAAIKRLKNKKHSNLIAYFSRSNQIFGVAHA